MHVERMAIGLPAGAVGALPVGDRRLPVGVPLRARRRRRENLGQELATPLAASFLGLLMVQSMQPAHGATETQAVGDAPATPSDAVSGGADAPMAQVPLRRCCQPQPRVRIQPLVAATA